MLNFLGRWMKMEEYKVVIIGAGISGMSCAIYLKRAGISTLIIENNVPGGQLNKATTIENYPGYESIAGVDLASNIFSQVSSYDVPILFDEIMDIDYDKKIVTVSDTKYSYKYLVFATGRREKVLGIENENKYIGQGISLCATCDGALYKNQDVIVVGGGSSAVSEALYLANICRRVYLIYRKSELRAEEVLKDRIKNAFNVEVIYNSNVSKYLEVDNKLEGVILDDGREVKASCIFLAIGYVPNSELFIGDKDNNYIIVDKNGMTSIDDVYACGDVILKDVYQLVTASSEGVVVANRIIHNYKNG